MAYDIFSTAVLNRLLDDRRQPPSVLLDLFFPNVEPATRDEIYFDEIDKNRRLAPFVSPLVEGKVVDMPGFRTKVFKPAYVKDKRIFEDTRRFRRRAGEPIGGLRSEQDRREEAVQANLQDQLEMLTRREEWMASQALRLGSVTVSGDEYPAVTVGFGRAAGHTVALTTTARWGESGVSPLENLNTWRLTAQANGGGALTRVVMDPLAWDLFRRDPTVTALIERAATRGDASPITELPYTTFDDTQEANVFYHGRIGVYEFWEYQMLYRELVTSSWDFRVRVPAPGWQAV